MRTDYGCQVAELYNMYVSRFAAKLEIYKSYSNLP